MKAPNDIEGEESSANFDLENIGPFLGRLSAFIESGFGANEIQKVCRAVDEMEHDEQREMEFPIRHGGTDSLLRVGIFMDDVDAPDLYFFSPPALALQIDEEIDRFFEELGS